MDGQSEGDAGLMLRVKQGDASAFEELVDKYKQPILNFVTRIVRDPIEAEDLAQSVFVQVYRSAERYKMTAKFSTWLYTIARNLCLNELRRRSRHPSEPLESTHLDPEDGAPRQFEDRKALPPAEAVLQGELLAKVEEAVAELPENQRTALLLFREKELSYEDIAQVLGCSVSATKSLLHRARETLKLKLKPYLLSGTHWKESEQL